MDRFGLIRALPMAHYRRVRLLARLTPLPLLPSLRPGKVGEATVGLGEAEARVTLWFSLREAQTWPRSIHQIPVVGLDGYGDLPAMTRDSVLVTRGEALELALLLDKLPHLALRKGRMVSRLRVVLGGGPPIHLSTAGRLLARYVGEMVLVGTGPHLRRIAQQILAETGLAVRHSAAPLLEPSDLVVWCGMEPPTITADQCLFTDGPWLARPEFSWVLKDPSNKIGQEISSYAAGEAFLLSLGGWKRRHLQFGLVSVSWVENIHEMAKDMGLSLIREKLDTPRRVGYNDYNLKAPR